MQLENVKGVLKIVNVKIILPYTKMGLGNSKFVYEQKLKKEFDRINCEVALEAAIQKKLGLGVLKQTCVINCGCKNNLAIQK